jgi:microcystin-dependent protein
MSASRIRLAAGGLLAAVGLMGASAVHAQEPFLGEIRTFGYNFCPLGWAAAEGQLLSIAQNTALFSLLGTQFGGNGQTTFALPDLRGRVLLAPGQGPGLSNYVIGQQGGEETHTLTVSEMPAHTHVIPGISAGQAVTVEEEKPGKKHAVTVQSTTQNGTQTTQSTGGGQPHNNLQPYLAMTTCIALVGIFPSRN